MKTLFSLCLVALLVGSTLPQRRKNRTTKPKTAPVQKVWLNSHCFETVRCDREALWVQTPDQSIWIVWKAGITTLFIRESGIEQEVCLLPNETTTQFRKRVHHACTDCDAMKDGSRAMLEHWEPVPAPETKPLDSPWVQAALEEKKKKNYQLDSLVETLRRRNTQ